MCVIAGSLNFGNLKNFVASTLTCHWQCRVVYSIECAINYVNNILYICFVRAFSRCALAHAKVGSARCLSVSYIPKLMRLCAGHGYGMA